MCSRYSLTSPPDAIRACFGYRSSHDFPPRYNIAPSQPVGIVRRGASGEPEFALVRWGLLPQWVKDPRSFGMLINTRAETAAEKPSFRGTARHRRCLVPADGFYAWSGGKGDRQPWLFRRHDSGPLAFAGLYENWLGADGSELETMTILTVPANELVAPIHDRMPAIVQPARFHDWLDTRTIDAGPALAMLVPAPDDLLTRIAIGRRVNDPRHEGADLQLPLAEPPVL